MGTIDTSKLAEQLTDFYERYENWHTQRLSREEAVKYHKDLLRSGNIITISNGEQLIGYCEFFKEASVCYINNLFILPEYRRGKAIWMMYRQLKKVCGDCRIYSGEGNKDGNKFPRAQVRSNHGF